MIHIIHHPSSPSILLRMLKETGKSVLCFAFSYVVAVWAFCLSCFGRSPARAISVKKVVPEWRRKMFWASSLASASTQGSALRFLGGKPVRLTLTRSNEIPKGENVSGELKGRTSFLLTFYFVLKKP